MPKKVTIDLNVIIPILVGIIVLLGVYIIVNKKENHVRFSDPVVTEEIIYQPYLDNQPILLQQPTYFNPNHHFDRQTNMYNIQMKEGFNMPGLSGLFSMPLMPSSVPSMSSSMPSSMPSSVSSSMPSMTGSSMPPSIMPSMNLASVNLASETVSMNIPSPMESTSDNASSV
jgi:hypothetical protein